MGNGAHSIFRTTSYSYLWHESVNAVVSKDTVQHAIRARKQFSSYHVGGGQMPQTEATDHRRNFNRTRDARRLNS